MLAVAAVTAPSALADSIVYEKSGNVWLANPDGSGQRQVTTTGGYGKPSQADDGTIIAAKDAVLHHLSRSGQLLNLAGDDDYGGKIFTDLSPDGALASYGFFANGPILTGPYTAVSHSGRPTEKEEIDGPLNGYLNPSWLDSNRILLFPQSLIVDVQIWPIPGDVQDWFTDPDFDLGGGDVDRGHDQIRGDRRRRRQHRALPSACAASRAPGAPLPDHRSGGHLLPSHLVSGRQHARLAGGRRHPHARDQPRHLRRLERARDRRRQAPGLGSGGRGPGTGGHGPRSHPPGRAPQGAEGEGGLLVHRHRQASAREQGDRQGQEGGLGQRHPEAEAEPPGQGPAAPGREERVRAHNRRRPQSTVTRKVKILR